LVAKYDFLWYFSISESAQAAPGHGLRQLRQNQEGSMARIVRLAGCAAAGMALFGGAADAATAFQWRTAAPSPHVSTHGTTGPVLADDFIPAIGGVVSAVHWWGSQAAPADVWEVTFHRDAGGTPTGLPGAPAGTPAAYYEAQHFVGATGVDPDGDGIFKFSAAWTPMDMTIAAGTPYWFSVANGTPGWSWAAPTAGGPQIGAENLSALVSVGAPQSPGLVGPHDGPWAPLTAGAKTDFAFRIDVAPVPPALALLVTALGGLAFLSRRHAV
jgi:hypothetical protein